MDQELPLGVSKLSTKDRCHSSPMIYRCFLVDDPCILNLTGHFIPIRGIASDTSSYLRRYSPKCVATTALAATGKCSCRCDVHLVVHWAEPAFFGWPTPFWRFHSAGETS